MEAVSCGYGENQSQFTKFRAVGEVPVSQKSSYVLHLTANGIFNPVDAGIFSNSVEVFKIVAIQVGGSGRATVCGVKCEKGNDR